jgi:hypothetical protein
MVLVFKTSVTSCEEVIQLTPLLNQIISTQKWSFDLEDCDKILRVETNSLVPDRIIKLLNQMEFFCQELEDIIVY